MALLDLPFGNPKTHGFKSSGNRGVEIKAATNLDPLQEGRSRRSTSDLQNSLMVVHRYFENVYRPKHRQAIAR